MIKGLKKKNGRQSSSFCFRKQHSEDTRQDLKLVANLKSFSREACVKRKQWHLTKLSSKVLKESLQPNHQRLLFLHLFFNKNSTPGNKSSRKHGEGLDETAHEPRGRRHEGQSAAEPVVTAGGNRPLTPFY